MIGRVAELSSAEIDRQFPYTSRVIQRTLWETSDHLKVNECLSKITNEHRCGYWNEVGTYIRLRSS